MFVSLLSAFCITYERIHEMQYENMRNTLWRAKTNIFDHVYRECERVLYIVFISVSLMTVKVIAGRKTSEGINKFISEKFTRAWPCHLFHDWKHAERREYNCNLRWKRFILVRHRYNMVNDWSNS
jgi:hypothetical protein